MLLWWNTSPNLCLWNVNFRLRHFIDTDITSFISVSLRKSPPRELVEWDRFVEKNLFPCTFAINVSSTVQQCRLLYMRGSVLIFSPLLCHLLARNTILIDTYVFWGGEVLNNCPVISMDKDELNNRWIRII